MFTITISLSVITAEIADARLVLGLALCGALAGGINGFERLMTRTDVSHSSFRGQRVIASLR